jgi:hypothetical protein
MRRLAVLVLLVSAAVATLGCENRGLVRTDDAALVALKSKCREDGEKVRSEWKETYYQDVFSDEPQYAYSMSLKTCLWLGEYRGPSFDKGRWW